MPAGAEGPARAGAAAADRTSGAGGGQFLWNGGGGQRKKLSLASLLLCVIDAVPLFRAAALTLLIFVKPTWKHLSGMSSAAYLSVLSMCNC